MSKLARNWEPLSEHQTRLVLATVEQFVANADRLLEDMVTAAISAAPALASDPALEESVRASVRAMTFRWSEAQRRRPGHRVPVDVPPEALDIARDLIRHGVDFQHLQTGYRYAENVGCRHWIQAAAAAAPPNDVARIADYGLGSINEWVGAALASITDRIEQERDELLGGVLSRRLETVTLILEGAPIKEDTARERLGYDLSTWHTGLVLWSTTGDHEQGVFEQTARLLALRSELPPPLTLSASATTAWVWLSSDQPLDSRQLAEKISQTPPGLMAAAGSSRAHMVGFRRTHREAVAARRVAERNVEMGPFTAYDDVVIAVLASQDKEAAHEFIAGALGQLANADPTLKETLRIYLQEDANTARTAARLFTHRNTILNRIERAERLLPPSSSGWHLRVGLALEMAHWSV
ncbi:PucR family transcriptional regulator [Rhodococcus koreensis]